MKIVHITDLYHSDTGHSTNNMTKRLSERGHDVEIYTSMISSNNKKHGSRIKIARFKYLKIGNKIIYPGLIPKILFQKNPDVIHSHVMGFFSSFITGYLKKIKKYPLVLLSDFDPLQAKPSKLTKPYWYFYRKLPTQFADVITTFTQRQKDELSKRFGINPEKIEVLPIGVDFKKFSSKPKQNLRKKLNLQDKFVILDTCFLSPKKNLELILRVLKYLPKNIVFLHVGGVSDINYKQKLDKMIKNLELEKRVIFLGKVSKEEMIASYHAADVFVQPGFKESFCIPIIEAMASGLPVVTTRVGVADDVIEDSKTGFIIKNENDVVNRINLLIEDTKLRRKIGRNAQRIAKKYDWDVIIDKLEKIYKQVVR